MEKDNNSDNKRGRIPGNFHFENDDDDEGFWDSIDPAGKSALVLILVLGLFFGGYGVGISQNNVQTPDSCIEALNTSETAFGNMSELTKTLATAYFDLWELKPGSYSRLSELKGQAKAIWPQQKQLNQDYKTQLSKCLEKGNVRDELKQKVGDQPFINEDFDVGSIDA